MKNFSFIIVLALIVFGAFLLVPKSDTKVVTKEECNPMNIDATKLEKVSATSATLRTDKGDIVVELFPSDAPKTVTNFASLANGGFYDCLTFHRVEPGFVIQGGDPDGNGTGGTSIYGPEFEDELNEATASYKNGYKKGVLAMANRGPNTNSSQFFIMLDDNDSLPKNYTIFGKVTSGIEVVEKIAVGDTIRSISIVK
jgi:cyclophilin family peptidyl-prolyl cis-trans isomerase